MSDSFEEYKKKYYESRKKANNSSAGGTGSESFEDYKKRYYERREQTEISKVDSDYINSFLDSSNSFFESAGKDYESAGWDNASLLYRKNQGVLDDLNHRREVIGKWMDANRGSLDDETYKHLTSVLTDFTRNTGSVMEALTGARDFYDRDKNQDAYLQYVDHQNKMGYDLGAGQKKIDDLTRAMELAKAMKKDSYSDPSANRHARREYQRILENYGLTGEDDLGLLLGNEKNFYADAEKVQGAEKIAQYITDIQNRPDFALKSRYKSTANGKEQKVGLSGQLVETGFDDIEYDYINKNPTAISAQSANDVSSNAAFLGIDGHEKQSMDEKEIAVYNYLYATEGREAAKEFLATITSDLNYRERKAYEEQMAVFAKDSPFGASVFSIATSPLKGISYLGQLADYASDGQIDQNENYNKFSYGNTAIRSTVAETIENSGKWGKVGSFAYNTGMSMGDFLLTTAISGGNSTIAMTIMGTGAASDTVISAKDRGLSDGQAFALGTVAGLAEAVTERVSLEALLSPDALMDGAWKYVLKNMLAEGSEEAASSVINLFGDILISKDQSEWNQSILKYMNEGKTREEAFGIVFAEQAKSIGLDALSGALSGAGMGGGGAVVNSIAQTSARNAEALELYGPDQEALVTEGLELDPDSKFAQRMQSRLDRGKDLTGGQLYKLGQHNEAAMVKNDISTIQKAAESALTNYGETGDVKVISEALAKQAAGKKLSKAERTAISESKYGQRVANEFDPENIRKGGYNTARAESLGTERINVEEYGRLVKDAEAEAEAETGKKEPFWNKSTTYAPSADFKLKLAQLEAKAFGTDDLTGADSTISEEVSDSTAEADTSVSLEEASKKYGAQAKAMVATYDPGQDVASFDRAYGVAYEMGKSGVSMDYAVNSRATSYLTQAQRELAYRQGAFAATNKTKTADALYKGMGSTEGGRRKGAVKLEGIKASEFRKMLKDSNDPRGKAAKALMTIAEITGIDIVLFKSQEDASGRYMGAQGRFEWKNDTIYIDVNAGLSYGSDAGELTKYAMLRTFGHEFTHFLEKNAASQYSEFRKLVFAEMTKAGKNVDDLIRWKQDQYKNQNQNLSYEAASREVVAESMGDILRDSNFVETLAQKHNSLFKTLLDQFKRFIMNIRSYFNSLAENSSPEAKALKEEINGTLKYMDSIVEAFDKMAVEAVENYQARMDESDGIVAELTPGQEGVVVDKDGEPVAYSTEDGTVMLSIRTYEEEGRSAFRSYLEKCVTGKKLTKTEMTEMLDGIEEIYAVCKEFKDKYAPFSAWSDAEVIRDTKGKPVFSVVTPNGEYKMNLDFSLVCKKRRALDAVFNEMSKRGIIDNFELGEKTVVKINELIRKKGFETACALCFVDARRFRQADVADSVVKLYNDLVMSLVPEGSSNKIDHFNFAGYRTVTAVENGIHTWADSELDFSHINEVLEQYGKDTVEAKAARYIKRNPQGRKLLQRGDFMSSGGFDAVKSQNQDIMKLYNSKKGTGGPKAAFGDVQYLNEVISKARWWTPAKAYAVGGVRVQSFSDYVPRMVFDYVQMIYDLSATKLPAHAYTKEALFVKQFGKTGIKINMSLIPAVVEDGIAPGLDANGKYVWAGESFDFETAKEIQRTPGYTENCGTICVGVSDEHILKLLRDPNIRMVIPYHKSGLNSVVAHMNRVDKFVDYTDFQNTKDAEGKKVEKGYDFNKALREIGDPKAVANEYLKWCDDRGYTPKFAEFRGEENYYKLLTDFTVYDESGTYVPQREVRAVFPKDGDAFGSMKNLIESGLKEDAVVQGARDAKISDIVDEIERTIPRKEAEISKEEQVEQADHDLEADLVKEDIDSTDDDRVQYRNRNYSDYGDIRDDIYYPKDPAGASAFLRSFANMTSHLKDGQRETVVVLTADNAYVVNATGYLQGDIEKVVEILGNEDFINKIRKELKNGPITGTETSDSMAESFERFGGSSDWYHASDGYTGKAIQTDELDGRQSEGDSIGDSWESYGYSSWEELEEAIASGAMIMDENGNVLGHEQAQLRTNTLTDHEILDMAAKDLDTSKLTDGEKAALDIFQKRVATLKALKEERQKQGSLYHEAQFGENRDKAKASAARNRMSVLDKQITRASAEVLSLEDKKVLKDVLQKSRKVIEQHERKASLNAIRAAREETRVRERKRADERIEALRQKKNERIAEVRAEEREKASERVQNVREGYKSSRLREKIRAFKSKLEKNLLQPTERQYVPAGLTQAMIDVVSLIDIDTDLINEDGTVNKAQERREQTKMKLSDLANEYERLKASDPVYAGEFDEAVHNYLKELRDNFSGRHLSEMTYDELTEMYEILRSIEETLQDARKLIGWGSAETVYEAGESIIAEQANITAKRRDGKRTSAQEKRDNSLALTLSPVRFVERMVGYNQNSYLLKMFRAFEKGVRKKNLFTMRAYKDFEALTSRKQFEDAVYNPVGNIYTDVKGRTFRLSKMQMMQAILSLEREHANGMSHIARGGFSFADLDMLRKGNLKEAISAEHSHRVANAVDMVGEFIDLLKNDKWAHDYMAAARKFFNETAKDAVNETSLILKHRIIAKDKSYIPFEVDSNFIVKEISAANDVQETISSYGMLKDTNQSASSPLIITGLNNVLDRHIERVGNVYGLAIEIRNFNKVWNVKGLEAGDKDPTVQAVIEENWGKKGKALVEQAVQDIQGPRINNQSDFYKKIKSGYIGATFLLNLSVVTKQIASMYSAASMLKWRGPVRQLGNLLYTMTHSKTLSAEVDKYTATAWMRRQGMSDAEIYTMMTEGKRSWLGRLTAKWPAALNPTKWITAMDHAVALSLWKYAKEDTAKRTGLKGEALLEATAEFYDQVIENTQSMTDMLHRPEIQKRNDVFSEAFGMFKTDLYQTAGQLLNTWERNQALHTKETRQALGRTMYSVTMSVVWAQLMTSVFALLRYKVNQYRDDEDKDLTLGSWMKRQSFSIMGDIAGYIFPRLGSEIVGVIENAVYGETDNFVDSIGLTALNNAYDSMVRVCARLVKGELPERTEMRKLTTNVLQMFGVPANNILRSIDAIELHAKDIANGRFFSFEAGVQRSASHHAHRIMEAVEKGNMELAQDLYDEAVEGSALKKSEDGSLSEDALKDARSSLKTAMGKKFKEGTMSREVAEKILTELFGISKDDVYWTIRGWETGGDSRYSAVFDAALSGKGFDQAVKEMTAHGYEKDKVLEELKDQIHTWYTDEESEVRISKQQATNMLTKYIGMKPDEVTSTINQWTCKVVTGIAYGDIKGEFLASRITASRAIDMRVRYGGKSREDAQKEVEGWNFEKKYGFSYSDRKAAYINGEVSASDLRNAMITYGGMTAAEADEEVKAYDWLKRNPGYDLSVSDVISYTKPIEALGYSIEQTGIKPDVFKRYKDLAGKAKGVDANGDGKADTGTKKAEIMQAINDLPISSSQKDALYYLNGWSKNTIHEAPWH